LPKNKQTKTKKNTNQFRKLKERNQKRYSLFHHQCNFSFQPTVVVQKGINEKEQKSSLKSKKFLRITDFHKLANENARQEDTSQLNTQFIHAIN
jgi:hypothetical protein